MKRTKFGGIQYNGVLALVAPLYERHVPKLKPIYIRCTQCGKKFKKKNYVSNFQLVCQKCQQFEREKEGLCK